MRLIFYDKLCSQLYEIYDSYNVRFRFMKFGSIEMPILVVCFDFEQLLASCMQ